MSAERRAAELEALDRVRRRVVAIVFFAVVSHAVVALLVVAHSYYQDDARTSDAVILTVMSGIISLIMVGVMRLMLRYNPLAPLWLVLALVPPVAGAFWVFG